ncbi:MAG: hypothetical protein DME59_09995 [Verrucomicrobia bacterium]|nr:MAG: hypothetical protein DME59_09995 [Verrucomicrobiota bacterium]
MSIIILHLSDIHAGTGELVDVDVKDYLPLSERERNLERLGDYIAALPKKPDYVVVSGDMTLRGDPAGLLSVREWLITGIEGGLLPSEDRIIVTPGNHDPTWGIPDGNDRDQKRYANFFEMFGSTFPHAYIPGWDPKLDETHPSLRSTKKQIGGLETKVRFGKIEVTSNHPFLLDLRNDVLIFAFNSSLACGVYTNPKYFEPLNTFLMELERTNSTKRVTDLILVLRDSTLVDAGLVGKDQLNYFRRLMGRMRKELSDRWDKLTKIAILHHHISHLWNQQLELKQFEALVDAAQLKRYLIENNFNFVLHGHKHTNNVSLDGSLIPVSDKKNRNPLCVVSGGTIGGMPRLSDSQTFKLIELVGDTGPRFEAVITEIPLRDTGSPSDIIAQESRIYRVPFAAKLPECDSDPELKEPTKRRPKRNRI